MSESDAKGDMRICIVLDLPSVKACGYKITAQVALGRIICNTERSIQASSDSDLARVASHFGHCYRNAWAFGLDIAYGPRGVMILSE